MKNESSFILSLELEQMFVKRGCKQCLLYETKKNAHLKAAAAFQGPPFGYDKWIRSGTMLCSNFKTKGEGKSWLISKEICPF